MIVQLPLLLLTALLTQCIQAINLGFFSFRTRSPNKITTTTELPIHTIITPFVNMKNISKSTGNEIPDSVTKSPVLTTTFTIKEKLELENDFPAATTEANKCANSISTNKTSGQEIDESAECSTTTNNPTTTASTTTASGLEIDETKKNLAMFPLGSFIPPIWKNPFPAQIFPLPKQKTITITKTAIKPKTKYQVVHPSCVKLEGVTGVCNGNLITIMPTPAIRSGSSTLHPRGRYEVEETFDEVEAPSDENDDDYDDLSAKPTPEPSTEFPDEEVKQPYNDNILEASELDYEFEEVPIHESRVGNSGKLPTPQLENVDKNKHSQSTRIISSVLSKQPKIEYVWEYIPSITTQTSVDYAVTVTVVASKCVPRNLNLPTCTRFPTLPVFPLLYRGKEMNIAGGAR